MLKDSHFHSILLVFKSFFRQPWMSKTGKQIGEVRAAWLCQLKELGFCSEPSFLLCVSNLDYCSWVLSRDLGDPRVLGAGGEALWCEWCTCVVHACPACSYRHTQVLLMENPSTGWKGPDKSFDGSTFSDQNCPVMSHYKMSCERQTWKSTLHTGLGW